MIFGLNIEKPLVLIKFKNKMNHFKRWLYSVKKCKDEISNLYIYFFNISFCEWAGGK